MHETLAGKCANAQANDVVKKSVLDTLEPTLFGSLYGYWEPPEGWQRERDSFTESVLRHPLLGTLTLRRQVGFDAMPIHFEYVRSALARPEAIADIIRQFTPSDYKIESQADNGVEASWLLRELSLWELVRGVIS